MPEAHLRGSAADAADRLAAQIAKTNQWLDGSYSVDRIDKLERDMGNWIDYNRQLLLRLFSNDSMQTEYDDSTRSLIYVAPDTLADRVGQFQRDVKNHVTALESIRDRLDLFDEATPKVPPVVVAAPSTFKTGHSVISRKVFVVHGHDAAAKEAVARTLTKLKLEPIILNEQPDQGKTIIEKFEANTNDISFAVVLLTPDDTGFANKSPDDKKPRARQNVVLELGYFVAKLGRTHVCALRKGGVEVPSDYVGVIYKTMDDADGWRYELAKELKAAGLKVSLDDL